MLFQRLKKFVNDVFAGNLTKREKLFTTASIVWMVLIGYLTWWNGLESYNLDKSFRWDEWIWFGVVPATVPYLFYFIWFKKEKKDPDNFLDQQSK